MQGRQALQDRLVREEQRTSCCQCAKVRPRSFLFHFPLSLHLYLSLYIFITLVFDNLIYSCFPTHRTNCNLLRYYLFHSLHLKVSFSPCFFFLKLHFMTGRATRLLPLAYSPPPPPSPSSRMWSSTLRGATSRLVKTKPSLKLFLYFKRTVYAEIILVP